MFTILNRLRGTYSIFSKINGIIIASILYIVTSDLYMSILTGVMYVIGESFGWGKWIGGIMSKNTSKPTEAQLRDQEGTKNGIHYLANLIAPMNNNYYTYCIVALLIRGIYWFGLTLLPLVIFGYMNIQIYVLITASLGIGFPLSVVMADGLIANNGGSGVWEFAEIIYGLIQDIVLLSFVWTILIW